MKLCIVTETFPPEVNGVAMTLSRIRDGLIATGHEVTVVRPRQKGESSNPAKGQTSVGSLPLPGYRGLRFGLPCRARLEKLWLEQRPDVIYVATEGPLGQSAIKAAQRLAIPVTSGFHTNFHQYMAHYKLPGLARGVEGFLRRTHNRTRRTFAPSRGAVERLNAMGITNTRLLGRGVDTRLFHPEKRDHDLRREWGVSAEGMVAIFVSRIAAEKNIPLALKAFTQVRRRFPGAACVLVGDGPERARLERAHPEFIFTGMRRDEDLARHYASGDLFVFPSTTETFGNVVTEAMASGLLPLAYDYAAPQEYIRDGANGFLVPFDDEEAYLEKLEHALEHRNDWPVLRRAARATVETLFWPTIVGSFAYELEEARREL